MDVLFYFISSSHGMEKGWTQRTGIQYTALVSNSSLMLTFLTLSYEILNHGHFCPTLQRDQ